MNHLKFYHDYNNKYCVGLNENPHDKKITVNLRISKETNRLTYLRCFHFLEKFFKGIKISLIKVKKRTKKVKHLLQYSFDLNENFPMFYTLSYKLPEPEIRLVSSQYIIKYNFYRFIMEIAIDVTDHCTLMKINQLFTQAWRDI